MTLPPTFQFSQSSLQDYVDCPRRFQLRYVERVRWPAPEALPALEQERYLQQGQAFHRLVHQHALGLPLERLSRTVGDDDLRRWWRHYLESGPADLPDVRFPEVLLSAPLGRFRLVAKYDLVAVDPGQRAVIVDWKTSRRRPKRDWLARRLQTILYPYLLVGAGFHLNGGQKIAPEQVEMVYWFTDFPADPERLAYGPDRYQADEVYLVGLADEITAQGDGVWPLTSQERRCTYCRYRSLCQRGVQAGPREETDDEWEPIDDLDLLLDFDQITEITY